MKPLPQNYDHREAEPRWQRYWEEKRVHAWESDQPRANTYVIDTPPPTVSGLLHMGHVYSYTHADFMARYQRMSGKTVFYPMGFDDNGLPTERLVEKIKKIRGVDLPREEFIQVCQDVVQEAEEEFRTLFRSIALSVDWQQEYQTISEHTRRMSRLSFVDLFEKGQAYRQLQPMLWDPVDQTAIAQAEVEDKELPGSMNQIRFGVEGGGELVIATTRPELIPACVAVFYHPEDERYKGLKGKQAITPLFGVKVPILADESVDPEKGTGIMMCCTFGDEADIDKWRRHGLPMRVILNKYGKVDFNYTTTNSEKIANQLNVKIKSEEPTEISVTFSQFIPEKELLELIEIVIEEQSDLPRKLTYEAVVTSKNCVDFSKFIEIGKKIKGLRATNPDPKHPGAREKILDMLRESGELLESQPITHAVKCAERSGAPLEILPTPQWFVKVLDKKEALKSRGKEIQWHPEHMSIRLEQWIDGLNWDWCISRQRYFGVPFPLWYSKRAGEEGKVLLAHPDDLPVNPLTDLPRGYTRDEVDADPDVMDTWATSSISPQISSHALTPAYGVDHARHEKLFPADPRPQAHEIIRTWLFYTVVKAHLHGETIPWHHAMISGWCLASDKSKMSKSKGNVITPVALIEEKGADAVRYWTSTARLGTDTAFSEDVLKIGKKLVTKLWNATKFAALQLERMEGRPEASAAVAVAKGSITEALDLWVLGKLNKAVNKSREAFAGYEYSVARSAVEDFFWNDFCDNYLELVKARAYGEAEGVTPAMQQSAIHTLYFCLNGVLKLFAPFVPHITEELYSHIFDEEFAKKGSIHARGNWPEASDFPVNAEAEAAGQACVVILEALRRLKSERAVSLKFPLDDVAIAGPKQESIAADLANAANAARIRWESTAPAGSTATVDGVYQVHAVFAAKEDAA